MNIPLILPLVLWRAYSVLVGLNLLIYKDIIGMKNKKKLELDKSMLNSIILMNILVMDLDLL